ncbi:TPA: hypothetical protein QB638_002198 [Pasteurella multocida]|nr:hypothetical protein [Pasteurella multocida]
MRVRRVDKNHDWTFGNSFNSYANQSEAIAQCVKTRLWSFANDWFLDLEHGLPWLEKMGRAINLNELELKVKRQVLETQGVKQLTHYESNFNADERTLTVTIDYLDIYGTSHSAVYRS